MRRLTFPLIAVLCVLTPSSVLVAQSPPLTPFSGLIDHVSADQWGGANSSAEVWHRAISGDGRYVVFTSPSSNLSADDYEDYNGYDDVFLRDRMTGTTTRISRPAVYGAGDGISSMGTISTNGRHVAFASGSSNLVSGDTNDQWDVFVRDLDQQQTVRVSVATDGTQGDQDAYYPSLSADGRFVAFVSWATTFAPGVSSSSPRQMYLHDRDADADGVFDETDGVTTELVSAGLTGGIADDSVDNPRVSSDGHVLFESAATNLSDVGNPNASTHLYLRNRLTGQTALIDRAVTGGPSAWGVGYGTSDMTDDGRFITFSSISQDIVWLDMNWISQVFLYDTVAGPTATTIVSRLPDGTLGDASSYASSVSGDGRYVLFTTAASNLASPPPDASSGPAMLAVRDMLDGSFTRVDVLDSGQPFDQSDYYYTPAISADGTAIVLHSHSQQAIEGAWGYGGSHAIVLTAFSASPTSASYSAEGGSGSIEVNTTAVSGWTTWSPWPWIMLTEGGDFGAGPRTVQYVVDSNSSVLGRDGWIRVGSKYIMIHQDGDGNNGDTTPPILTPTVTGTQVNGWYTTDITVTWSVSDPESEIVSQAGCASQTVTFDTVSSSWCEATSHGGTSFVSVPLRRDTTPPSVTFVVPRPTIYSPGSVLTPSWSCHDGSGSGAQTCALTEGSSPLDTTPGRHVVTMTATDRVGLVTTKSVEYFVGSNVCVVPSIAPTEHLKIWVPLEIDDYWRERVSGLWFGPYLAEGGFYQGVVGLAWSNGTAGNYLVSGLPSAASTFADEEGLTIAAWVKPMQGSYTGTILSNPLQYRVARFPDGTLRWAFNEQGTGFTWRNTGVVIPSDVWSHVAVTFKNGNVRAYLNGRMVSSAWVFGDLQTTGDPNASVTIAGRADASESLMGAIDEVLVFNEALTDADIDSLALAGGGSLCVPHTSTITLTAASTVGYGATIPLTALLTDEAGTPLPNRVIEIGSRVGPYGYLYQVNGVTAADGRATVQLPVSSSATLGYYANAITAFHPGDVSHRSSKIVRGATLVAGTATVTWPSPAAIVYGAALAGGQLNATANVAGTFTYSPAAGTVLNAGTQTLSVTFTPSDTAHWAETTKTTTLVVNKATPTVTATGGTFTYDNQPHAGSGAAVGVLGEALTPVTLTYDGSSSPPVNAGTYVLQAQFAGDNNYIPATTTITLTIAKATPTVTATGGTFPFDAQPHAGGGAAVGVLGEALTPVTVTYNGSASVPINGGTYAVRASYAGSQNYTAAQSADATITITRVTPTVEISTAPVFYTGQPRTATVIVRGIDNMQLPHIVFYDGSSITQPTNAGTYALEVQYFGSPNYVPVTATGSFVIRKATPVLGPLSNLGFTYDGQPHSGHAVQIPALEGGWLTPVIYTYNGSPTAPVNAGVYTSVVRYDGSANYEAVSATYTLTIFKKAPQLTWGIPAYLTYGQPLGAEQLDATANVPGTFTYTPPAGTILPAGDPLLTATFTPDDPNYQVVQATHYVTVLKANPQLAWPFPGHIVYGTPLTGTQLNATANTPGTFVYNPPAGTVLAAGQRFLQVTFTPDDLANYNTGANLGWWITVAKATPVVSWNAPADIVYGTALGAAQLNATANAPGTFTYSPAAGAVLDAGMRPLWVTFTPTDAANYNSMNATVMLNVARAQSTISWNPADIVYGTALGAAQLNATGNVSGYFSYSPYAGTVLNAGSHTLSVTFTPWDANHDGSTASVTLNVAKAGTTLIWQIVADPTYGTPLGVAQLTAFAVGVAGTLTYSPPAGTILNAGVHTLSVTFTPNDPANYNGASATVLTEVSRAASTISWPAPAAIGYGTALGGSQLNATANVPGTFTYSPAIGTVLNAGWHTLSVSFTPDDAANYVDATKSVALNVTKAASTITWSNPGDISYGAALGASQLNATANVAGTFSYSPAAGTVLGAGSHTLTATFTPDDAANYYGSSSNATLNVTKAASTISWSNPADIVFGAALGAAQLNATGSVAGTLSYSPAAGTVLGTGSHTLTVTFTPDDAANYNGSSSNATINVTKAASTIGWSNPAHIVYGAALGGSQLNATANVPGTFSYSPASGTVLNAGSHTLSVTFTPDDGANYNGASANVSLTVSKAASTISWSNPAGIVYGAALGTAQLNATANVAGTFSYSPAAGTVLGAGTQTLSVTFTPDDAANYESATASVSIAVAKAAPVITWANPAGVTYGTALSGTQLNATANVNGSFAYSPAAGTVPGAGTHDLSVTFTPADGANYTTAGASASIVIAPAGLTVQTNNAGKVYGEALPAFTASGAGFVNGDSMASLGGTLSFATSATATSAPGAYPVTPSGVSSPNYSITFAAGTLTVTKAATSLALTTTPSPSQNNQTVQIRAVVAAVAPGAGTATGTVSFYENGTLLGSATLVNGVATMNKNFKRGTHPLTATYAGSANFTASSGAVTHSTQ